MTPSKSGFAMSLCILLLASSCSFFHNEPKALDLPPPAQEKVTTLPLNPESYLRKLSLHLRGFPPRIAEFDELNIAKQTGKVDPFLKSKRQEYLSSPDHVEKMNARLNELYQIRADLTLPGWPGHPKMDVFAGDDFEDYSQYKTHNSLNALFRSVVKENASWDTLLTGSHYRVYNLFALPNSERGLSLEMDDPGFVRSVYKGELPPSLNDTTLPPFFGHPPATPEFIDVDLAGSQAAGAISTSRFFNRYPTTFVNKNRKRAAAVFRLFLCDEMAAVAVDQKNDTGPIFDLMFPPAQPVEFRPRPDQHGGDQACLKCHYKLDPMGAVFSSSPFTLSATPAAGALVFKNKQEQMINIPVKGLAELAQAIRTQPEYAQCQVRHFWNWFIGIDVVLNPEREKQLTDTFNSLDRKTNDFISYLLDSPEYWSSSQTLPSSQLTARAQEILKRCDSCHQTTTDLPILAEFPIGGSNETDRLFRQKIGKVLDLFGNGSQATMPPRNSNFQLNNQEREIFKAWLGVRGVRQ